VLESFDNTSRSFELTVFLIPSIVSIPLPATPKRWRPTRCLSDADIVHIYFHSLA